MNIVKTIIMNWEDKVLLTLREDLEPLGFQYLKSMNDFKHRIDKNTMVYLGLIVDRVHHGFTDIVLYPAANYRDIEEVQYKIADRPVNHGRFRIGSRVEWLIPKGQYTYWDLNFRESDDEKTNNEKLELLLSRLHSYALPYIEKLSHKDSALEETIALDRKGHLWLEGAVPVMYCIWKHDKKAALDYLEEKRLRLLKRVEPWEWDLVERYRKGERFGRAVPIPNGMQYRVGEPFNALAYDDFMGFVNTFNEWLESDMNPIRADL